MTSPTVDPIDNVPLVTFYRVIPTTIGPIRADKAALGVIPASALQYCEALRQASSFGWYVFPPKTFYVKSDGYEVYWMDPTVDTELWKTIRNEPYPELSSRFDSSVPTDICGFAPPFLSRSFQQPNVLQIWSGLFASTRPGWSLLVRPPANLPQNKNYDSYEGIVDTDEWFGPLFTNIRITTTNLPIEISLERPLFQVQPLLRETYSEGAQEHWEVVDRVADVPMPLWDSYRSSFVKAVSLNDSAGAYAARTRRRAKSASD